MADAAAAPSLGDFFKSKSKKKVKATNLNKADEKKAEQIVKKTAEDDAWQEEQVVAATMKVEVAGKLVKDEEKKEDEDTAAPAWGNVSKKPVESTVSSHQAAMNERKYPTLAKSVGSSAINIDDGSDAKVNITTSKNHFAALEGDEEEDEGGNKRPKEIKPAMVTKKKGEREKVALQREVDKYKSKPTKKKAKKDEEEDGEDDEDESEEEDEDEEEEGADDGAAKDEAAQEARKKKAAEKKEEKKAQKAAEDEEAPQEETKDEDCQIKFDMKGSKEKYEGRKKMPSKDLPRSELEEEKENKPKQQASGKKKKFMPLEEEPEKKLQYADWD